jgi:hypothetical protein
MCRHAQALRGMPGRQRAPTARPANDQCAMTMGKRVDPGQRAARFAPKAITAKALAVVMGAADRDL